MKSIKREELKEMIEKDKEFTLVDVRSPSSYEKEYIPGSLNIPLEEIESRGTNILKKDENIVVYCGSSDCNLSPQAAEKLTKLGYKNVCDFEGGVKDWKDGGYHVESSVRARAVGV